MQTDQTNEEVLTENETEVQPEVRPEVHSEADVENSTEVHSETEDQIADIGNEIEVEESAQSDEHKGDSNENSKSNKFKNGDEIELVRVRFPGNAKSHPFMIGKRKFSYGQKVVAMSDRGMAVGYVNSFPYELPFKNEMLPLKAISKVAAEEDIRAEKEHLNAEKNGSARLGVLQTAHGEVNTPAFMPVGTVGAMKAMHFDQLKKCGAEIMLCNTYHLMIQDRYKTIEKMGGLHKFMNWDKPILTDCGGFQAMSLCKLNKIKEGGVIFRCHLSGKKYDIKSIPPELSTNVTSVNQESMRALQIT